MTLETDCNECNSTIGGGDKIFCDDCYTELKDRIEELEADLKTRDERIEELKQEIADVEAEVR